MSSKKLVYLIISAIIFVICAYICISSAPRYEKSSYNSQKVYPSIIDDINNISEITFNTGVETFSILHEQDDWVVKEKKNYFANGERVRRLLLGIAEMEYIEPKTKNKERYSEIGVNDPLNDKHNRSREIVMKDKNGKSIVSFITSGSLLNLYNVGTGTYLRKSNDEQSWLVKTGMDASGDMESWVLQPIINLSPKQIKNIKISSKNKVILDASRDTTEENIITKVGKPAQTEKALSSLSNLRFIDIDKKEKAKAIIEGKSPETIEISTFSGMMIEMEIYNLTTEFNLIISVSADRLPEKTVTNAVEKLNKIYNDWIYTLSINDGLNLTSK